MYRVGTLTDNAGGILLQGDVAERTVTIRDTHVELVPGKRVVVSDLGQGNNQLAIVRTLGVGTPPPPPVALDLTTGFSNIIAQLAEATSWTAAWVKTVKYSLTHYASVVPGITGTAYATLFRAPEDYVVTYKFSEVCVSHSIPSITRLASAPSSGSVHELIKYFSSTIPKSRIVTSATPRCQGNG